MAKRRQKTKTRLQRKREKESLRQAGKYLFFIVVLLFLMVRFGLPGLIKMATFVAEITYSDDPIEKQDTIAPMTPQLIPLPEATHSSQLDISGYGESGSIVELFLRGISVKELVVDSDGDFKFKDVHLKDGKNQLYVIAKDDDGNLSLESKIYDVLVDSLAPEITIDSPGDGMKFFDSDNPIMVTGTSEYGIELKINGRFVMVDSDDKFDIKLNLKEGDNKIEVVGIDKAGNISTQSVTVNYSP